MKNNKFVLTDVSIEFMRKKLFQIKAITSFWNVCEWALWWYVEKEENLCVSWDAWVSWNAWVSWEYKYTKWHFIWWDDSEKITRIEDKMWTDYWKAQYVLWDYKIEPIEEGKEENKSENEIMIKDGKKYKVQILEEMK
jgi:hypothetical protein